MLHHYVNSMKKVLISILVVGVGFAAFFLFQENPKTLAAIPNHEKLKTLPEKVVAHKTLKNGDERYYYFTNDISLPFQDIDESLMTPNSYTRIVNQYVEGGKVKQTHQTTVIPGGPQFLPIKGKWKQIESSTTTPESFNAQVSKPRQVFIAWRWGEIFFPKAHAADCSFGNPCFTADTDETDDGYVDEAAILSWADVRNATAGTGASNIATDDKCAQSRDNGAGTFTITRGFFSFKTTSIAGTINAASIFIVGPATFVNGDNDGDDLLGIVGATPAATNFLVVGDYDQATSTEGELSATKDMGTWYTDDKTYNEFALNSAGLGYISVSTTTQFALREFHDWRDKQIAITANNVVFCYFSEQTGTSLDPKLIATTTVVVAPARSSGSIFFYE